VTLKHDEMDESYHMGECLWHPSYGWNESQEWDSRFIEIDNMNNEMYYRDENSMARMKLWMKMPIIHICLFVWGLYM
jgi:hypothetical protein